MGNSREWSGTLFSRNFFSDISLELLHKKLWKLIRISQENKKKVQKQKKKKSLKKFQKNKQKKTSLHTRAGRNLKIKSETFRSEKCRKYEIRN